MSKLTEKILKEIKELKEREPLEAAANYSYRAGYKRALSAVEGIIHFCAEDTTEWIPVEERLPEEEGEYLVTFSIDKKVHLVGYGCCQKNVFWKNIGFGWYDLCRGIYFSDKSIIAWMPLPDPYK